MAAHDLVPIFPASSCPSPPTPEFHSLKFTECAHPASFCLKMLIQAVPREQNASLQLLCPPQTLFMLLWVHPSKFTLSKCSLISPSAGTGRSPFHMDSDSATLFSSYTNDWKWQLFFFPTIVFHDWLPTRCKLSKGRRYGGTNVPLSGHVPTSIPKAHARNLGGHLLFFPLSFTPWGKSITNSHPVSLLIISQVFASLPISLLLV